MNILLPICYLIVFAFIIYKCKFFKSSGLSFQILIGLFSLKFFSALALHFIYTYYYSDRMNADIFKYFDDSYILFQALQHSPSDFFRIFFGFDLDNESLNIYFNNMNFWTRKINYGLFNDNQTIIRANAIIMLFSWGNIYVHHVFAAFISLVAYLLIFKVFYSLFSQQKTILILFIFLIPSSLFWASSMLKECILMLGLGMLFYGMYKITKNEKNIKNITIFILGLFLLSFIKIYVIVALIPAILGFLIAHKFQYSNIWKVYIGVFGIIILAIICNQYLHFIPFLEKLTSKRNDFIMDSIYYGNARSYLDIGMIQSNLLSFLIETPRAIFRCISLPYIWNISQIMEILPAIENFTLYILVILMFIFYKKPVGEQINIIWFSIYFSIGLLWLVGITTPVVGAIVRYKMPIFPFLYTIFALVIDWQKLFQIKKKRTDNGNNFI